MLAYFCAFALDRRMGSSVAKSGSWHTFGWKYPRVEVPRAVKRYVPRSSACDVQLMPRNNRPFEVNAKRDREQLSYFVLLAAISTGM
jgi:hypothetical protein